MNVPLKTPQGFHFLQHQLKQEQCLHVNEDKKRAQRQAAEQKPMLRPIQHLVNPLLSIRIALYHNFPLLLFLLFLDT